jgi:putative oxidoreductase
VGLMLQRLITSAVLVYSGVTHFHAALQVGPAGLPVIDVGIGVLLLVGLWTPVAGIIIAGRELCILLSGGDPWLSLVMAILGATIAMIGPGAWSVDARLFGRRQIRRLR